MSTPRTPYGLSELDFGLTWLAGQFHLDWRYAGSAENVLVRVLNTDQPAEVTVLRNDARLARTGLPAAAVEALWQAVTGTFRFGPDGDSPSGPAWLDTIVAGADGWFAEHPGTDPVTWSIPDPVGPVLAEIEALGRVYRGKYNAPPAAEVLAALADCARNCSADLALRFLLRTVTESNLRISREWYERLQRLGNELGYGEFVVGAIDHLIEEPDDTDREVGG